MDNYLRNNWCYYGHKYCPHVNILMGTCGIDLSLFGGHCPDVSCINESMKKENIELDTWLYFRYCDD